MNKGTLFLLFFVVLLGAGVGVGAFLEGRTAYVVPPLSSEESPLADTIPITLLIEGDEYEVNAAPGSSVYDVMAWAQENSILNFKGSDFPGLGFLVEEINGRSQNSKTGEYWIYYVNGKMAKVGISMYILKENDVISWRYKKEYE